MVETGEQWDKPNGWAPLQWMAIQGFKQYGNDSLGDEIAWSWLHTVNHFYKTHHKLIEKYHIASSTPARRGRRGVSAAGRLRLDERRHPSPAGDVRAFAGGLIMRLGVVAGGILRPDALTLALSHRERETLPYAGLRQPRLIQDPMPRSIGPLSRKRERARVRGKNALPPQFPCKNASRSAFSWS